MSALVPTALGSNAPPSDRSNKLSAEREHSETLHDSYRPGPSITPPGIATGRTVVERDGYISVQVNVDAFGNNIPGDAANEPSIAVDPTDPNRIVIGWRQFDSVESDFRQAGWAYSHDAGVTWTFPNTLDPGVFGSDPVLGADANGVFYYLTINFEEMRLFRSIDGGVSWLPPTLLTSFLADKPWMAIDRTDGIGSGNIYVTWSAGQVLRSFDGGLSFEGPHGFRITYGTTDVAPDGSLYGGNGYGTTKSSVANDASVPFTYEDVSADTVCPPVSSSVPDDATATGGNASPNPGGLLAQGDVETDHSNSVTHGNVYSLYGARCESTAPDPGDLFFARSEDGGSTWSNPIRINDDSLSPEAWQWFGMMDVAPNGRIDVVWNDTRNSAQANLSELYYAFSRDGGRTWSPNIPVSPMFDSHLGWPNQNKLGDYYDMVSDTFGTNIAYAATFNGEQDVYFLRIDATDCRDNGAEVDVDCNGNGIPDSCESDFDGDGTIDACDEDSDNDGVPDEQDVCRRTPTGIPVFDNGQPRANTTGGCDVELNDYWRLYNCMTGARPNVPPPEDACYEHFDTDGNLRLDLVDFAVFQNAYTGAAN